MSFKSFDLMGAVTGICYALVREAVKSGGDPVFLPVQKWSSLTRARDKGDMTRCETMSQAHHLVLVVDGESVDPKIAEMGKVEKGWTRDKGMYDHQLVVDDATVQRKGGNEQN